MANFFQDINTQTDEEVLKYIELNDLSKTRCIVKKEGIDLFKMSLNNSLYINTATATYSINRAINKSIFNQNVNDYNKINRDRV